MDRLSLKYPIYIVSKGRWENPFTAKSFKKEKIPFKVAVEPEEYDNYCKSLGEEHVARLPFSNLGVGSFPARNWCWENSRELGFDKHFLFDDNIRGFSRLNDGKRKYCEALPALITLQNFHDRYENLAISGYNYSYFVTKETMRPMVVNTHVYSGMLIQNEIEPRWRLKYNEDVDLCLQVLDSKRWCTVLLNAYLINKISTVVKLKGGNQDELYKGNNHYKKILKARSLEKCWPQYAKTVMRFNRPHHSVSWKKFFHQPLVRKKNYEEILNRQMRTNG